MFKNYLFLLFFCVSILNSFSQSDCSGAQSYIVYALSNSKAALEANNLTHAKYYAAKAKESFERVQATLNNCPCDEVDDFVYDAIAYLAKAESAEKKEQAYYLAQKGKELALATIEKLDACTMGSGNVSFTTNNETDELSSIAKQQEQLKLQQLALEQKQEELKQKLIEKEKQESTLKKEALISRMTTTVNDNIKTYNEALTTCNCETEILRTPINQTNLTSQSLDAIRLRFIKMITELSVQYTLKLKGCI